MVWTIRLGCFGLDCRKQAPGSLMTPTFTAFRPTCIDRRLSRELTSHSSDEFHRERALIARLRIGSVLEIVEDGIIGKLVESEDEAVVVNRPLSGCRYRHRAAAAMTCAPRARGAGRRSLTVNA